MATKTASTKANGKKAAPAKPAGFDWPKPAKDLLTEYLKAEVTDAQDAPNRAKPFINENGVIHIHSTDWRAWLKDTHGLEPGKAEAAKPLRDAKLSVRTVQLPGEDRALGFYVGKAPAGTARLPRRVAERASRPRKAFRRLTDEQRQVIGAALTAYEYAPEEAKLAKVRDELLEQLG
jgi:hypothetical protein